VEKFAVEKPWLSDIIEKKAPEKTLLMETKKTAQTMATITTVWLSSKERRRSLSFAFNVQKK
jgi:hypothetical protein